MSASHAGPRLGRIGAWFNPLYDDDTRTELVVQAEALGYPTAWLGFGRASIGDLALVERILDATATITVPLQRTPAVSSGERGALTWIQRFHRSPAGTAITLPR